MTLVYLHIIDQAIKVPVLGVYAEAYIDPQGVVTLTITIRHERGRPVELKRVELISEEGLITVDLNGEGNITLVGCIGRLIPLGGVCKLRLALHSGFLENVTYKGVVFLSEGMYPIAFTPIRPR